MFDYEKIKHLASVHGTPLYLYSRKKIEKAVTAVRETFPGFEVIYSVKANPFEPVLLTLRELGVGIDAASRNEILTAARLGFAREDLYYSAPGKSRRDIQTGLSAAHLIADSMNELRLIDEISQGSEAAPSVGVRLNIPNPAMQESKFEVMGGAASKFGVDLDEFLASGRRVDGLHVYFGSQLTNARLIAQNFMAISRAAALMAERFPLEYINYGGGFGVAYEEHEKGQPDLKEAARLILADENTRLLAQRGVRRNIELGRFLTATAGIYVSTVADVKRSGGICFVILDGGMNAFFRPKFTGQTHRVTIIGKAETNEDIPCRLVGNTCTPLDVFYEDIRLPQPQPGDMLIFENAGAYGYSMSLQDFISFDRPAQVMEDFEWIQ